MPVKNPAPPAHDDIVRLVGELEDETLIAIRESGASAADIEKAAKWAAGEFGKAREANRPTGKVAAVYDILVADPSYDAEPER